MISRRIITRSHEIIMCFLKKEIFCDVTYCIPQYLLPMTRISIRPIAQVIFITPYDYISQSNSWLQVNSHTIDGTLRAYLYIMDEQHV